PSLLRAKALGCGTLAALLATETASCFAHGDQGGTFNGNPLMCAAGIAGLGEVSRPGFLMSVTGKGGGLPTARSNVAKRYGVGEMRGRGLLQALALGKPLAVEVAAKAFEAGLLLNAPRPDSLRFMPSLTLTQGDIERMTLILDDCLGNIIGSA